MLEAMNQLGILGESHERIRCPIMKLLIVTPSRVTMEGWRIRDGLASAAMAWPEFEVQVCTKLVGGPELQKDLKKWPPDWGCPVHYFIAGISGC